VADGSGRTDAERAAAEVADEKGAPPSVERPQRPDDA